jgi:hypothetical protein
MPEDLSLSIDETPEIEGRVTERKTRRVVDGVVEKLRVRER